MEKEKIEFINCVEKLGYALTETQKETWQGHIDSKVETLIDITNQAEIIEVLKFSLMHAFVYPQSRIIIYLSDSEKVQDIVEFIKSEVFATEPYIIWANRGSHIKTITGGIVELIPKSISARGKCANVWFVDKEIIQDNKALVEISCRASLTISIKNTEWGKLKMIDVESERKAFIPFNPSELINNIKRLDNSYASKKN